MLLLGFPESDSQARALADAASLEYAAIRLHRFPDGESQLTLPTDLPERVVVFLSLHHPNDKLVELYMLSGALRETGVRQLTLVAPYLCYMRQDKAFHPGEVVSQHHIGRLLADCFDALITVDPHLHRTPELKQAVPVKQAVTLHPTRLLAEFLHARGAQILVGPDGESAQWVEAIARPYGLAHGVATKERHGDRKVTVHMPELDVKDKAVVLVDDMVSTGHTLAQAARLLFEQGAASIDCAVTHALLDAQAEATLKAAGIRHLWSTDAVPHKSNAVALTPLLAEGLSRLEATS
jgi:ribose-phosphate pyrophosphokinase